LKRVKLRYLNNNLWAEFIVSSNISYKTDSYSLNGVKSSIQKRTKTQVPNLKGQDLL